MGSREVRLFHDHLLVKEPGTLDRSPWHQDQPYYPIDGAQTISFWIPLDPVARPSTLEFVTGTHTGPWFMPRSFVKKTAMVFDEGALEEVPDVDADRGFVSRSRAGRFSRATPSPSTCSPSTPPPAPRPAAAPSRSASPATTSPGRYGRTAPRRRFRRSTSPPARRWTTRVPGRLVALTTGRRTEARPPERRRPRKMRGLRAKADEGTRTLDLLHGKQTL